MGLKFEKIKKNLTNRTIPGKPGQVRGNRNIFKVGPVYDVHVCINELYTFVSRKSIALK